MNTIITAVTNKRDVILTTLQGFERSRFLLKTSLLLLVKVQADKSSKSFDRIVHVSDKDYNIKRICHEIKYMPFGEFDLKLAQIYGTDTEENKSSSLEEQNAAQVIVCNLKHIFSPAEWLQNALVIFDGITLENIEGTCGDVFEQMTPGKKCCSPSCVFTRLKQFCWSVLIACNPPVDGLPAELKLDPTPVIINDLHVPKYRTFSSILASGPTNVPYDFNANVKHPNIHSEVGAVLERTSNEVKAGGILVFFPSYGRMVEYHNAWKQSGLFERLGLTYGRENRAGDIFKNGLRELAQNAKSIFLFSIRYHQDEMLAEFALSLASVVIVVGLPLPFTNDSWDARIKASNESYLSSSEGQLSGSQVYKYRGIEFMNGVLKRCLNEYRYKDCNFFLLDSGLKFEREKVARELVEATQEETYEQSMYRFHAHCN